MRKIKSPRGRIWVRERRLIRWNKYLPQNGRFLDVGCAEGYMVIAAKKIGKWVCVGLDIQIQRMQYACFHYLDVPFFLGLADELCFKDEKFNIITMTHLLEHTFNPLVAPKGKASHIQFGHFRLAVGYPRQVNGLPHTVAEVRELIEEFNRLGTGLEHVR